MRAKKRVHVTMAGLVLDGLEALATLQGRALSDLLEELGRGELERHGITPEITADDIKAEIAKRKSAKGRNTK